MPAVRPYSGDLDHIGKNTPQPRRPLVRGRNPLHVDTQMRATCAERLMKQSVVVHSSPRAGLDPCRPR